jgi:hypothetical protein
MELILAVLPMSRGLLLAIKVVILIIYPAVKPRYLELKKECVYCTTQRATTSRLCIHLVGASDILARGERRDSLAVRR